MKERYPHFKSNDSLVEKMHTIRSTSQEAGVFSEGFSEREKFRGDFMTAQKETIILSRVLKTKRLNELLGIPQELTPEEHFCIEGLLRNEIDRYEKLFNRGHLRCYKPYIRFKKLLSKWTIVRQPVKPEHQTYPLDCRANKGLPP